jgi:hypothetical protein
VFVSRPFAASLLVALAAMSARAQRADSGARTPDGVLVPSRPQLDADAAQQLRIAILLDPYYGPPHLLLATMGDLENYTSDAIAEYQQYIALAARSDPQLPRVKARLAKLSAGLASTQPH